VLAIVRRHEQFAMCWSTPSLFPSFLCVSTSVFFITVHNGGIKLPGGNLITSEGVFGCQREFLQHSQEKKRSRREYNYALPSSAKVKMNGVIPPILLHTFAA